MIIFSIELSTVRASVAICDGGRVLAEVSWVEPMARHQRLFDEVPGLLDHAGIGWEQVDRFAVGRGPGAFSGIRIGLMAAQMFAAPLAKKVVALSSMAALAGEIETAKRRNGEPATVICGDARRGMFWYGVFGDSFGGWLLSDVPSFAGKIPAGAVVATPHWAQTAALRAAHPGLTWLEGERYPTAHGVAALARVQVAAGKDARVTFEALEPIYLHPPV